MTQTPPPTISLICTVRDEADNIAALLDSMLAQSRPPDEIVINDCLSKDATPAIVRGYAERYPQVRLVTGGHNISSGRNNAIAHAHGRIIACTDAGLTLDPHWLAAIVAPIEAGLVDQVGGFFRQAPQSLFELTLGATNYPEISDIDPVRFLPSGNCMAFRKEVWEAVGGFPEWLSHCEDLFFGMEAEQAGFKRAFVPEAVVNFRPRHSLAALAKQYFFYARGDGVAGLWPRRHAIRYASYAGLLTLLTLILRSPRLRPLALTLLALGSARYSRVAYRRLWPLLRGRPLTERLMALALVPLIKLVGDVAKMVGYPVGRWRRR